MADADRQAHTELKVPHTEAHGFHGSRCRKGKAGAGGGGAITKAELGGAVQPVGSLNPHHNRWAIKARIATSKSRKGTMKPCI